MQLSVGDVLDGKVIGITKFGAFVEISENISGLVHISEISSAYVINVADFLSCGDVVKVKILNLEEGKISLSIKQVEAIKPKKKMTETKQTTKPKIFEPKLSFAKNLSVKSNDELSFEEMLSQFKKNSEEKISDLKRNLDGKRSSYSKKR